MVYKAKVDTWLIVVLAGTMIAMLFPMFVVPFTRWGVLWVEVILALFFAWIFYDLLFRTRYIIDGDMLRVRFLIFGEDCRIDSITEIRPTRTWLSAPAPSLDRIQIKYGKYGVMVISPLEKEKFIAHLCEINPRIRVIVD